MVSFNAVIDEAITHSLEQAGLISGPDIRITPLTGGVSSEILLLEDGSTRLVVKRALPKLKVKDDWFADVSRNRYEQEYMKYVASFLPDAVPRVLHSDPERGFFVMEYLGEGYANWKKLLLDGQADHRHARRAGQMLGTIHARSRGDVQVRRRFDTTENFYQLRIEPYLITTGQRHLRLRLLFEEEARRLAATRFCLVHGDYSPKNILIGAGQRMVILDCEVAWFGDPAFDLAFLFNHFLLKSLYHATRPGDRPDRLVNNIHAAWEAYTSGWIPDVGLEFRTVRLLLMLLLARIDGKSPVEYITDEQHKELVRAFVRAQLSDPPNSLPEVTVRWREQLRLIMPTAAGHVTRLK